MENKLIAPCGIDCFNCEMYADNLTEAFQERLSKSTGIPAAEITCGGCTGGEYCLLLKARGMRCKTLDCAREKGVEFCCDCAEFPCVHLMPLADSAGRVPHNIKLFNLCMIKKLGAARFAEQAGNVRHTYFNHKFVIGAGGSDS
ncbi:MAG: DUF3795 domain-containing protein [Oscillospiraceae bacterium]